MVKKRNKYIKIKTLMLTFALVMLNAIGVGYGYFSQGLDLNSAISTANMKAEIIPLEASEGVSLKVEGNNLLIEGEVKAGTELHYSYMIKNTGTIAIEVDGKIIIPGLAEIFEKSAVCYGEDLRLTEVIDINQWNAN